MKAPNVAVYGSHSCPDTTRATEFLRSRNVAFEFKDVDDNPEYNDYIAGLNDGKRVMPTIRVDNAILINPDPSALGQALDEATSDRA